MSKMPRRVLVADSDHACAEEVRRALEARGYAVETVNDGLSAINTVKTKSFSGAVVDTDLMTVDGVQVLVLVKDLKPALPVVVTGSRARLGAVRRARGDAFIPKPCAPERIADALQHAVSGGAVSPRAHTPLTLARLEPGQVLLIECTGGQVEGRLASRLLAQHPASLAVAAPMRGNEPILLPFGVAVAVGFPMPDGWYYFDTHVLGAVRQGGEPALLLTQPRLISHIQRRRFARTAGAFAVRLGTDSEALTAAGVDACEGGLRVLTERPLAVGARFPCRVADATGEMSLAGMVVWSQELRDNGKRYRAGIELQRLAGGERKRLLAWLAALGA